MTENVSGGANRNSIPEKKDNSNKDDRRDEEGCWGEDIASITPGEAKHDTQAPNVPHVGGVTSAKKTNEANLGKSINEKRGSAHRKQGGGDRSHRFLNDLISNILRRREV